ncbi:MAG: adenylate kinase [Proteobacteria bacterium SG_bin7]|nr:MAG: adenylate kinase [Proteobacteria bacterium SG_bin7]
MNIVLFGPPGAGKGTQSALLVQRLNMYQISTGDLFRTAIKNKTPLGIKAKSFIDQGELVPDDVTIGMVSEVFERLDGKNFILDGFPRTLPQANALDDLLKGHHLKLDKAVFIEVRQEELILRITGRRICRNCGAVYHLRFSPPKIEGVCDKCGESALYQRTDDTEDAILTRFSAYKRDTLPLVEFFKKKGSYVGVNGTQDTEVVYSEIKEALT